MQGFALLEALKKVTESSEIRLSPGPFLVGALLGALGLALCIAAGDADARMESEEE